MPTNKKPVAYWAPGDVGPCLFVKETDEELGGISEAQSPAGYCGWNAMFFNTREARKAGFKSVHLLVGRPGEAAMTVNKLAEEAGYVVSKDY
jgi:hypothetical protein